MALCELWNVCILYEAALNLSCSGLKRQTETSLKHHARLFSPPHHRLSILCLLRFFFFIAAANAAARTETKLALWPPPLPVCWRVCLFSMSPPQPPSPAPSPCSPSNLSLKNFFSSLYNFFFLPPHICTSITRPGNGRTGESCDLRWGFCLGEEEGKCVSQPIFLPQLRGQRSAWRCSSQFKPQKSRATFTLSFHSICLSLMVFLLSFFFFF